MKTIKVQQNSDEWLQLRKGKITGSKLKDIVVKRGTGKKLGFYELIADRLSIGADEEDVMERGHRLEEECVQAFIQSTGIKLETDIGMWISDENENIAISPDAAVVSGDKYPIAFEAKCLSASRHIQALVEQKIPDEYEFQKLQYFIVNPYLETLYFGFYDPRVTAKPFHYIKVDRKDVKEDVATYLQYQIDTLKEVEAIVEQLAF